MVPLQESHKTSESHIDIRSWDDPGSWNEFVLENDGPLFATWDWGTACAAYGHDRVYLGATHDGDLVGVLPMIYIRSRLFGDKLVSMPFSEYGSVIIDPDAEAGAAAQRRLLAATRELADDLDVDFVSLRGRDLGSADGYERKQRWVSFRHSLTKGVDAVWDDLDSTSRRGYHVRQARENDLTCREGDTIDDLKEFYHLYLMTMRGHGSPALSFGFFRRLWEDLHEAGHMRLYLVENDGDPINSVIDFAYGKQVYHWKPVSDYEYRDLDGGSLILWEAIKRSAEDGYETYNLGRTREGSGVYTFKKSFGGRKVRLTDHHYWPNDDGELPHPEADSYEHLKRVWRRLPLAVTKIVGPPIRKNVSL